MTSEELAALPPAIAIRVIAQALGHNFAERLASIEAPKLPRPPKYDMRISRKGGYQWASETDLEGLRFWLAKFESGAAGGGQYAEKDGKNAQKLRYWVDYRVVYPAERWNGQRNDEQTTARLPSSKPLVYEWEPRRDKPLTSRSDADDSEGGDGDFPAGW